MASGSLKLQIGVVVFLTCTLLGLSDEPVKAVSASAPSKARIQLAPGQSVRLTPAADSEVTNLDATMSTDAKGVWTVKKRGEYALGSTFSYFWIVDTSDGSYAAIALTGRNDDATRVAAAYARRGLSVPESKLRERLRAAHEKRNEDVERAKGRLRDRAAAPVAQKAAPSTTSSIKSHDSPGASSDVAVVDMTADLWCSGGAIAVEEAWEPARWVFPVTELTRTTMDAGWYRNETEIWGSTSSSCWANPETFVWTTWSTNYCAQTNTNYSYSFDSYVQGEFENRDFWFDLFTTFIWQQAGVQWTQGSPHWYGYTSAGGEWGWLISGHTFGWANEDCSGVPAPHTTH